MNSMGLLFLAVVLNASCVLSADAMNHRGDGGRMGRMGTGDHRSGMTLRDAAKKGLPETGLKPMFSIGYACRDIASNFGSPTRYDGNKRPHFRNAGLHGSMDLSLAEATPILALADGVVNTREKAAKPWGNTSGYNFRQKRPVWANKFTPNTSISGSRPA